MAPTSSPTLGVLVIPNNPPPLLGFLCSTLSLHRHLKITKGKETSLTLAGSANPLTDYYTVLTTLQKTFVSSIQVPSNIIVASQSTITSKPLSNKDVTSLLSNMTNYDTFLSATSGPSLLDYHVYFSLSPSSLPPSSRFFDRWLSCLTDSVTSSLSASRGVTDPKIIGKLTPIPSPTLSAVGYAFVDIGSCAGPTVTSVGDKPPPVPTSSGGISEEAKALARTKREAAKKEKAAKKPKPPPAPTGPVIEGEHVGQLDIRVGKLIKVWEHETADKLFCEDIDLGPELGVRQIASGLRPFYRKEDMEGKMVMVLCNLKKRNLVGFPSHGMVMCASNSDHTSVELVLPPPSSELGERITCEGFITDPEPENKIAKKKIFEKIAPELVTDEEGVPCFRGVKFMTKGGECKAEKGMKGGHVA
ncbi:hypothetical protein TrVE_jg4106 [Triparma verrucosa]|uniref:tRNA-binding domain-containing protein n=1 Tax=Triparma verrucosa TaxID=1606542 RepID=A0A9W7F5N2_9STRA|nr:hypothetical protein TrVE_jg4106 [Triparma verrucosa]